MSFCRRNPPAGFPAGRVSAPGVPRVPSKRQVWRGYRDILISAWRVWLRFFRAVPSRRPNTRISEGENEQIVNAHPKVSYCQYRRCGIPAAQSQDMTQTYGIVGDSAARMLHLLFAVCDIHVSESPRGLRIRKSASPIAPDLQIQRSVNNLKMRCDLPHRLMPVTILISLFPRPATSWSGMSFLICSYATSYF